MDISGPHKLGPLQIQPLTHLAPIVKILENYMTLYMYLSQCCWRSVKKITGPQVWSLRM